MDFPFNSMVIFHGKMLVHQRLHWADPATFLNVVPPPVSSCPKTGSHPFRPTPHTSRRGHKASCERQLNAEINPSWVKLGEVNQYPRIYR